MPRLCAHCGPTRGPLPLEEFGRDSGNTGGLKYSCRSCLAQLSRERRAAAKLMGGPGAARMGAPAAAVGADVAPVPTPSCSALTVAIGDTHFMWHHRGAMSWALNFISEHQPDNVVQMGDLYDWYSFSKYPRSHNVCTPLQETTDSRAHAEFFWSEVRRLAPLASCYQLGTANHDLRPAKRALEYFAAAEKFVEDGVRELLTFPGVALVTDDGLELDGVLFEHGYLRPGQHAAKNRRPTVIGHLHRGYVQHVQDGGPWEMCVGWLGDVRQPVFSYVASRRAHGTTLGLGAVDVYGPRFIRYPG